MWLLHYSCFSQKRKMDSLNASLKNAPADTSKLWIYMNLLEACEKKDKLNYTETAWSLVDKLFLQEKKEALLQKLIETEVLLPAKILSYYSDKDTTDWNKAMPYLVTRLESIEKTGYKKRTATFLYEMARVSLDEKKDSAMFRTYISKSIEIAKEIKDSSLILNGYGFMRAFYASAGNFSSALEAAQSSMAICRQLNYDKGIASSHEMLGLLYGAYGEDELALTNYQSALDIAYKIKDEEEVYSTLLSLSTFYSSKDNTNKALEYLNKMLDLCNSNHSLSPYLGYTYQMIGGVYSKNKDYKNALINFDKSLSRAEEEKNSYNTASSLLEIGNLYSDQGDFEKAVSYHTRSIQIIDSVESLKNFKGDLQYYLAKDYYGLKKYDKAKEINDMALVHFKRHWFHVKTISLMELLAFQIDSVRVDGVGALAHYKEYVSSTERMRGEEIKKAAEKDKFKTEIEKQKSEQEKKDAIAKRTRNLQYIAIGAFLLLGIFLTYGYVQKNKDKKRIEKAYADLKSTQAQLVQSEKMASLGELTAGIAHEIQNPLNFVNNFSEVNRELISELVDEVDNGNTEEVKAIAKDISDNEEKINHHGKRADAIVKGMLQHSRSSTGVREPTDINKLADEYLRLAYHGLRAKENSFNATIKTDFDNSIGKINIIPQDIGRVLLNLYNNAFYAVNEKAKLRAMSRE